MEELRFKLEQFEGPLDMLLHLVAKNKVNICDISIVELIDQYMRQIELVESGELELSSEFLNMAARLILIKTASLLPRHEEAQKLEKELKGQLIEYGICKIAAANLARQSFGFNYFVRTPMEIEEDKTYRRAHTPQQLLEAYMNVSGRKLRRIPPSATDFQPIVAEKNVSVSSRVVKIMSRLKGIEQNRIAYIDLFEGIVNRSELVSTFMAALELIKSGYIEISDGEKPVVSLINSDISDEDMQKIVSDDL